MKKVFFMMVFVSLVGMAVPLHAFGETITCWFPPGWKAKGRQAKMITATLSEKSGLVIKPRIARSYPEILAAFAKKQQSLVYVGSFVQAIIKARNLGTPLVQNINGKELYSGVMIFKKGEDPEEILRKYPTRIAYAVGASSGESSAKAATGGKAAMGVANHGITAGSVKAGKAKGGLVKNWWWESNKQKFPMLDMYKIPGVSIEKNPDNVLTASKSVPADVAQKISDAAKAGKDAFGATEMATFDQSRLDFSLDLMKKGKIDPQKYSW